MNGQAEKLDLSQLPKLPRIGPKKRSKFLTIGLPIISVILILAWFQVYFWDKKEEEVC
jgi:hypothetical protein